MDVLKTYKMKLVITVLAFVILNGTVVYGQADLTGTWKLKKVIETSGKKYSGAKSYTLVLRADQRYEMYFGGTSWISGKWELNVTKLKFEAQSIADPCMEWKFDNEFKSFEMTSDGTLIIDMFVCNIPEGRSYFKKVNRKEK